MVFDPNDSDGFDFEPSEHEPTETDPEADLYDPDTDSLTIPQVDTDPSDADPELSKNFWAIVLLTKGAAITLPFGVLSLLTGSYTQIGHPAFVVGLVLAVSAFYRFKTFDPSSVGDDGDGDGAEGEQAHPEADTVQHHPEPDTAGEGVDTTSDRDTE